MVNSKHIWNPDLRIADIPVIHGLALDGRLECPHPFFSFGTHSVDPSFIPKPLAIYYDCDLLKVSGQDQ